VWVLPVLVSAVFAWSALRDVNASSLIDTDAARHAMNGAFLHDLLSEGKLTGAVAYARAYYTRYPALSIPYHPPLFPAFESLFFFIFGVNLFAARLAIAVATVLAIVLLYRLVMATHRSPALAAVACLLFFGLPSVVFVSREVMLEMPTLVFTLAALWFVRDLDRGYPLGRGLAFALFAGAAFWTKQNALFLGLVPFLMMGIERRWRLLFGKTIWISSAIFGAAVLAFLALTRLARSTGGTGDNPVWLEGGPLDIVARNVPFYAHAMRDELSLAGALFVTAAFVWLLARRREGNSLYLAWALAVFLEVWSLRPFDQRYLLFAYPALAAIAAVALFRLSGLLLPRRSWVIPAALAAWWAIGGLSQRVGYLRGPAEAAATIAAERAERVVYCGRANGQFIFRLRSLDPAARTIVLRGDKLPPSIFTPAEFEKFAHAYGISHVVIERRAREIAWNELYDSPSPSMELLREFPIESSEWRFRGYLRVFRFKNPSAHPESTLKLKTLGGGIDAEL
jgi:hypothetical protein